MPYTAEQLETIFLQAGQIRKGNPRYANDSGYWTGGHCNWGANHVLKEDCREIAKAFGKLESLNNLSQELRKATNNSEFESKKAYYLTRCNEIINGLSQNSHSSMFGICIIWSDQAMSHHIERIMTDGKQQINSIKSSLANENYSWVEEIKRINLEINQINQRMRDNQQKALQETDPIKKLALIAAIEEDGKVLSHKQNELAKMERRHNFDASGYVRDMVEAMKQAIQGNNSSSGSGGNYGRGSNLPPRNPHNQANTQPTNDSTGASGNTNPPKRNWEEPAANQSHSQLLMIAAVILILFLMMSKNGDENHYPSRNYYDY